MTCIVGIIEKDKVWIGGDSVGVAGHDVMLRKDPKVFKNGSFLIGFTSSFRMGQILRFKFQPPQYYPEKYDNDIYKYMCTDFIDAIRKCFKNDGYSKIDNNKESEGHFLVGFKGRLFHIQGDFQVAECIDCYNSVGCGEDYAKGSLHTSFKESVGSTEYKIKSALKAAEYFSTGVQAPFIIESI